MRFVLKLTEMGLQFVDATKVQHAARAATLEQSKSLKPPPLVPTFASKLAVIYNNDQIVWPLQHFDLSPCKLLHGFCLGDGVDVKQLATQSEMRKRMEVELAVWGIKLALEEFSALNFIWNRAKMFGVQWQPREFLEKSCKAQHPLNPGLSLPTVLADTIEFHARQGLHEVAKKRIEFFMLWNAKVEPCVALAYSSC